MNVVLEYFDLCTEVSYQLFYIVLSFSKLKNCLDKKVSSLFLEYYS